MCWPPALSVSPVLFSPDKDTPLLSLRLRPQRLRRKLEVKFFIIMFCLPAKYLVSVLVHSNEGSEASQIVKSDQVSGVE